MKHITIFDKPYSKDKVAEGMAISEAIKHGDCDKCGYFLKCFSNTKFKFPENAPCMQRKRIIERGLK